QPVEQPVTDGAEDDRPRADREQPLPVTERPIEEEDFLIGDREVREGVPVEVPHVLLHHHPRVDDGRGEEPQRQDVGQDVLDVAKVHRQRCQNQRQSRREQQLHEHDNREPDQLAGVNRLLIPDQEERQNRQAEEEVHHVRQHADDGQHFGREEHLLDQIAVGDERVRRLAERGREPRPRQDAAEHEQRVGLGAFVTVRNNDREDERIDQQQQERIDERPEISEYRSPIPRFELAHERGLDEAAVVRKLTKVRKHGGYATGGSSGITPSICTRIAVMLSGPPASLAASIKRLQADSTGPSQAMAARTSAATTPHRPSLQSSSRSPGSSPTSRTSTSGSAPPEIARVTTLRQGCRRASSSLMAPARTCSPTHEWSSVSWRSWPARHR